MKFFLLMITAFFSFNTLAADINWMSYEDARALKSDKPIFVFAKMRFCGACKQMEEEEFIDPELITLLNEQFIPVEETVNFAFSTFKFDDLKDKDGNVLKFKGFPSVMVVMGDNYSVSQGYKTADMLKAQLARVAENI